MKIDHAPYSIKRPPTHLCQMAGRWNGLNHPSGGAMIETKVDGWRALYFRGLDGAPGLWTKNGHRINGVGHILHKLELLEQVAGEPMFFDGEFQVDGCLSATKSYCERDWKLGEEKGTFFAFDCLTQAEWSANNCARPLFERKAMLRSLWERMEADAPLSWEWREGTRGHEPDTPIVEIMADLWASDGSEIRDYALRVWSAGGEGAMVKDAMLPYERSRTRSWLKVKTPEYVSR